ncbi:unnamed protein product [Arctogadus glacialis]
MWSRAGWRKGSLIYQASGSRVRGEGEGLHLICIRGMVAGRGERGVRTPWCPSLTPARSLSQMETPTPPPHQVGTPSSATAAGVFGVGCRDEQHGGVFVTGHEQGQSSVQPRRPAALQLIAEEGMSHFKGKGGSSQGKDGISG